MYVCICPILLEAFNSLTTIGYLLEVFIKLWIYLPWSIFSLLLGASTRNLSQGFFDTFSVSSRPWTHPLINERSIVRALRPENAPLDYTLPKLPEMESLQGEGSVFYTHLCKAFLQAVV